MINDFDLIFILNLVVSKNNVLALNFLLNFIQDSWKLIVSAGLNVLFS